MSGQIHWGAVAAEFDHKRAEEHREVIVRCAEATAVPPAIVAGIGSREMRWSETALGYGPGRWLGDPYPKVKDASGRVVAYKSSRGLVSKPGWRAVGPLQVDEGTAWAFCERWKRGELTVEDGIAKGLEIFCAKVTTLLPPLRSIPPRARMRAFLAAYNCGERPVLLAIERGQDVDRTTTPIDGRTGHETPWKPGDYSADVSARADWFFRNGFPDLAGSPLWQSP